MTIFPELFDQELQISQVNVADEITLTLHTTSPTATCPCCGTVSKRVQSRYRRTLHDLPFSGRPVRLIVLVRRFFCKKSTCTQKIFAEQLPELCRPYAQRTKRLQEALCQLGLVIGGQVGARVGNELGISGSRDTILRLVRKSALPKPSEPRVIGLDDWAWKRGQRYGTLICDLERGLPIDLLPDRAVETVSAWLQAHTHIDIVSRDGSKEYAAAILKGAPQATQVMDRWHITKHLAQCVEALLAGCRAEVRQSGQAPTLPENAQEDVVISLPSSSSQSKEEQVQQARRAERQDHYEQVVTLHKEGLNNQEIAQRMRLSVRTIGRWLVQGHAPGESQRRKRASRIDAYQTYLQQRWQQGCRNGIQLFQELQAQGFRGSQRGVYRYLATLGPSTSPRGSRGPRPSASSLATLGKPTSLEHFSARHATWLFLRKLSDLDEKEQEELCLIREASPRAEAAYQLVTACMQMLREQTGEHLEDWLDKVRQSQLVELEPFVAGIRRDRAAILAGLSLPWNNGPLEGQVNRLKLIKKSMYGRAKFDLLRLRVLHQRRTSQHDQRRKTKRKQKAQVSPTKLPEAATKSPNSQHTTFGISEVA